MRSALRFLLDFLRLAIVVALLALLVLGVPAANLPRPERAKRGAA